LNNAATERSRFFSGLTGVDAPLMAAWPLDSQGLSRASLRRQTGITPGLRRRQRDGS
jgi:hypothetical protein